jgi:hypothetical protein
MGCVREGLVCTSQSREPEAVVQGVRFELLNVVGQDLKGGPGGCDRASRTLLLQGGDRAQSGVGLEQF